MSRKVTDLLNPEDRVHWEGVVRFRLEAPEDKYDLAYAISDELRYVCDRLTAERIFVIQKMWEEMQKAWGFEPIASAAYPAGTSKPCPDPCPFCNPSVASDAP